MKKVFIFGICSTCNEPTDIVRPCEVLGYNRFPLTNFHGELSIEETEELRSDLIKFLIEEGEIEKARSIKFNTRVIEVTFNI